MVKRASIEFLEVASPITETVTKFGGQPVWLSSPQWPVSRELGQPMRFIGQVYLDPGLFGAIAGRMAYLFMTDSDKDVDGTWEPNGGENAVIVQPGDTDVQIQPQSEGPTLYRMVSRPGHDRLVNDLVSIQGAVTNAAQALRTKLGHVCRIARGDCRRIGRRD